MDCVEVWNCQYRVQRIQRRNILDHSYQQQFTVYGLRPFLVVDPDRVMRRPSNSIEASQSRVMLRWRAIAECARIVFPDVINDLYGPDEMGADVAMYHDPEGTSSP